MPVFFPFVLGRLQAALRGSVTACGLVLVMGTAALADALPANPDIIHSATPPKVAEDASAAPSAEVIAPQLGLRPPLLAEPVVEEQAHFDEDEDALPVVKQQKPQEYGLASWYGVQLHRRRTASGERFDMHALTAAHRTLPFGSLVCVRSLVTGREVVVRINDRGPHAANRVIDLSRAAADALGVLGLGTKPVTVSSFDSADGSCPESAQPLDSQS